jgi:hypothetical protein
MLSLYFQRHHLRRTAGLTLLAWVLALLAGTVNACQVQLHGPGTQASVVITQGDSAERGMRARQTLHREAGDHDGAGGPAGHADAGKGACLKFCDDESSTVAKGEATQTDLPGIVKVASTDWLPAMPTATVASWRSVEQQGSQGPPLFIRFLRLTI